MYICPKCALRLRSNGVSYKCENNHTFDISSKGYVNLLLGGRGGSHGDSKEMLLARRRFLNLGYYYPIIDKLTELFLATQKSEISILDAGCGEGYYTSALYKSLSKNNKLINMHAIDVSKDAISLAAKDKNISFSVASINALPFVDGAFDVIISLFAPLNELEFTRALKPGGILVTVSPSENHLFGLKQMIYSTPYKNPPSTFVNSILKKTSVETIEYQMELNNKEEISDLFKMTPYYHKSSREDIEKALSLEYVKTDIGFNFITYQKC